MPNQTPNSHTPLTQTPSPADKKGIIAIKPPIISPEIYERFRKLTETPFSQQAIDDFNEAKRQLELKQQQNEFIEINGIRLETENLGRPQNPKIKINQQVASETIPQAWRYDGLWYYNFPGAQAEAKYLGKKIPTKEQWKRICKVFGNDGQKLKEKLCLPMAGFRDLSTVGYYNNFLTNGCYWSSSSDITNGFYLYFDSTNIGPIDKKNYAFGFSVRCIKKEVKKKKKKKKKFAFERAIFSW